MERVAGRAACGEAAEQAGAERRQDRLNEQDVLALAHVDVHLQAALEAETDRRIGRAGAAHDIADADQLVGDRGGSGSEGEAFDAARRHAQCFRHVRPPCFRAKPA
jgi:hypothetical protein